MESWTWRLAQRNPGRHGVGVPRRDGVSLDQPGRRPDSWLDCAKIVLFANTDWYLYNFRLSLAEWLKSRGAEVVLLSPPGPYTERFEDRGFRWVSVPFERLSLSPLGQLRPIRGLVRILGKERPTLIHNFTIKCAVYGSLAARVIGVPGVVNAIAGMGSIVAGGSAMRLSARRLALFGLRVALRGTEVIVQNPDDLSLLCDEYRITGETRCTVVRGSGVDVSRFRPVVKREHPVIVLFASRLLRTKGVAQFVSAARAVRATRSDVEFVVAGAPDPGNPDTLSDSDVCDLSESTVVRYVGHVSDVRALLDRSHVVVLPTTYGEGVPRILVEGASCGLPLIASNASGCREIVKPGVNGYLVTAGDLGELVDALKRLLSDSSLRARMGSASRRIAEDAYSEELVNAATLDVYRRALTPSAKWA